MSFDKFSCERLKIKQTQYQPQIKSYLPKANQNIVPKSIFSECQVLCVIEKSMIAVHFKGEILLIDQHAACEKLLYMQKYEQLRKDRPSKRTNKIYRILNIFSTVLRDKKELIYFLGWQFSILNRLGTVTEIHVTKQPLILTQTIGELQFSHYLQILYEMEHQQNIFSQQQPQSSEQKDQKLVEQFQIIQHQRYSLKQKKQALEGKQAKQNNYKSILKRIDLSQKEKEIIAEYACHHSYKFGEQLPLKKAEQLVRRLSDIQAPFNCPHSRLLISYYGNVHQLRL